MRDASQSKRQTASRRRESLRSTGRGGSGNLLPNSQDAPSGLATKPQVPVSIRGREHRPSTSPTAARSTGRGGVGNILETTMARFLSRVPDGHPQTLAIVNQAAACQAQREHQIIQDSEEAAQKGVHSSGRGGLGNIFSPKSRSRAAHGLSDKVYTLPTASTLSNESLPSKMSGEYSGWTSIPSPSLETLTLVSAKSEGYNGPGTSMSSILTTCPDNTMDDTDSCTTESRFSASTLSLGTDVVHFPLLSDSPRSSNTPSISSFSTLEPISPSNSVPSLKHLSNLPDASSEAPLLFRFPSVPTTPLILTSRDEFGMPTLYEDDEDEGMLVSFLELS